MYAQEVESDSPYSPRAKHDTRGSAPLPQQLPRTNSQPQRTSDSSVNSRDARGEFQSHRPDPAPSRSIGVARSVTEQTLSASASRSPNLTRAISEKQKTSDGINRSGDFGDLSRGRVHTGRQHDSTDKAAPVSVPSIPKIPTPCEATSPNDSPCGSPRSLHEAPKGESDNLQSAASKRRLHNPRQGGGAALTSPRLSDSQSSLDLNDGFDEKAFNDIREKLKVDLVAALVGVRLLKVGSAEPAERKRTLYQILKLLKVLKATTMEYSGLYQKTYPAPFVVQKIESLSADVLSFVSLEGGQLAFHEDKFDDAMSRIPLLSSVIVQHLNIKLKGI